MQIDGLTEVLDKHIAVDYHFMNTKHVNTEESQQLFYETIRHYLSQTPSIDVLIVGDDSAFSFAMTYQEELFPDIPIISLGVNQVNLAIKEWNNPNVVCIVETLSFADTLSLASQMYPEATEVVAILDDTPTGMGGRSEFYQNKEILPNLTFREINASHLSQQELIDAVAELGEESILIFVLCSEDADGNLYASAEAVPMLSEAAGIPMFTVMPIGLGKGVLGGNIVSHTEMGRMAGTMAMELLSGADCSDLSWEMESPKMDCFDETVMNRFGIDTKWIPENAVILNHQETFWERNYDMIWISMIVGVALLVVIIVLISDNLRRRKLNHLIKEANDKLQKTALYDSLTGIRNRSVLTEDLQHLLERKEGFGILLFDLDNFKQINDIYGHNEGDESLRELAKRAEALSDKTFTPYRYAGDEFIAIIKSANRATVEDYMRRLYQSLSQPYLLGGKKAHLTASIGAAMYPQDGVDTVSLIKAADIAMYHVKHSGKNNTAFYDHSMEKK